MERFGAYIALFEGGGRLGTPLLGAFSQCWMRHYCGQDFSWDAGEFKRRMDCALREPMVRFSFEGSMKLPEMAPLEEDLMYCNENVYSMTEQTVNQE